MRANSSFVAVLLFFAALVTQADLWAAEGNKIRVGTYDNRAIAIAFAPSKFNPVAGKMRQHAAARKAGDKRLMKELENWGNQQQRKLHRMGFSRVPVDSLLQHVQAGVTEVARRRKLDLIAWNPLFTGKSVEVIDITDDLVALFDPSAKTREQITSIRKKPPVDLDRLLAPSAK